MRTLTILKGKLESESKEKKKFELKADDLGKQTDELTKLVRVIYICNAWYRILTNIVDIPAGFLPLLMMCIHNIYITSMWTFIRRSIDPLASKCSMCKCSIKTTVLKTSQDTLPCAEKCGAFCNHNVRPSGC